MLFTVCPSTGLRLLNLIAHGLALGAILVNHSFDPELASLGVILVGLSAVRRLSPLDTFELRTFEDHWFINGGERERLLAPVFTGHWFLVCRFSRSSTVCIGRDSLPDDDYRRLSALLRVRANRMMAVSG